MRRHQQAPRPTQAAALAPLLKWPGGKRGELERILAALPDRFDRYIEPFVGGGATYFAMPAHIPAAINDASTDLMDFYRLVRSGDRQFLLLLEQLDGWWRAIAEATDAAAGPLVDAFRRARRSAALQHPPSGAPRTTPGAAPQSTPDDVPAPFTGPIAAVTGRLHATVPAGWSMIADAFVAAAVRMLPAKLARMQSTEQRRAQPLPDPDIWASIEGACKAACYTALRANYNRGRLTGARSAEHTASFFALREYAYASMFRFNARGEFNVPYGGISYNRKYLGPKVAHLTDPAVVDRLGNTTLANLDFAAFFDRVAPQAGDFVFLDPPYDSDFSAYDHNSFARADHERLAAAMAELPCAFQLVIKSTPAVLEMYARDGWQVSACDKTYRWTIKDRNDRTATHLMITNYPVPDRPPSP